MSAGFIHPFALLAPKPTVPAKPSPLRAPSRLLISDVDAMPYHQNTFTSLGDLLAGLRHQQDGTSQTET